MILSSQKKTNIKDNNRNHYSLDKFNYSIKDKKLKDDSDPEIIQKNGLTRKKGFVKILGNGEITNSVNVKAHAVSESAKKKIEDAGGTVEVIEI